MGTSTTENDAREFRRAVSNLLRMKPKPHEAAKDQEPRPDKPDEAESSQDDSD